MLKKMYELDSAPVQPITWEEYAQRTYEQYQFLLENSADDESVFQRFFEKNPAFVPGAFELFGPSGHYPYMSGIISQPEVGGIFKRKPDFAWLAQDSLSFCPVFIEIERPSKRAFIKSHVQSAELTQALDQINEWKMLLNNPINNLLVYDYFKVSNHEREKKMSPQYGLIFGRRSEFEDSEYLTRKRAELSNHEVCLMSYDRIKPTYDCQDLLCLKMSGAKSRYNVITIPPTFRYSPCNSQMLSKIDGFYEAIDSMEYTSSERKNFLKKRYSYWRDYGILDRQGIFCPSDRE